VGSGGVGLERWEVQRFADPNDLVANTLPHVVVERDFLAVDEEASGVLNPESALCQDAHGGDPTGDTWADVLSPGDDGRSDGPLAVSRAPDVGVGFTADLLDDHVDLSLLFLVRVEDP